MKVGTLYRNPLFWVTITLPFVLCANIPLLPTYDDWSSTPGPNPNPFSWQLLLPMNSYWRPLENLYGYLIAHQRWLMPWLSHVIVITGHFIGTVYVYKVSRLLLRGDFACFVSTLFFWVSTGAIATVTACDGMSQTWVHTLGLIALYSYLKAVKTRRSNWRWLLIVALATIVKENGTTWSGAIPIVAYAFRLTQRQLAWRHVGYGLLLGVAYTLLHFSIPVADDYNLSTDYFHPSVYRTLRGLALLLTFSWLPLDYTHLLHAPHRDLCAVFLSFLALAPFIFLTFVRQLPLLKKRESIGLLAAFFILVGPHLITIFSLMHVYASLGMAALLTGYFVSHIQPSRKYLVSFFLFVLVSVVVNAEHCYAAFRSGMEGKRLSYEAINGAGHPVESAFLLIVEQGETRYSNFFVISSETFDHGNGILWETQYEWPKRFDYGRVADEAQLIEQTLDSIRRTGLYECIWTLRDRTIKTELLP